MGSYENVISRQFDIANGEFPEVNFPKFQKYTLCNLRGGIGKTTLAFNLSYLGDDVLAVDVRREIYHFSLTINIIIMPAHLSATSFYPI